VLRRSGARRITVLTVARADRRSPWSLIAQTGSTTESESSGSELNNQ
jgi:hypothetical protein